MVSIGSGKNYETILQGKIVDNQLEITYGTGWEEYLHDPQHPEFKELVGTLQNKMNEGEKGKSAGKFGGKFKGKFEGKAGTH